MKKRFALLFIAIFLFSWTASAEIPGPSRVYYVSDYASLIPDNRFNNFVVQMKLIEGAGNGHVVISTVNSLDGTDLDVYADEMFQQYQVGGEAEKGILILLVKEAKQMRIKSGAGMQDIAGQAFCDGLVEKHARRYLKKNNYITPLTEITYALQKQIAPDTAVIWPEKDFYEQAHFESILFLSILVAVFVAIILLLIFKRKKRQGPLIPPVNPTYIDDWRFREVEKLKDDKDPFRLE